MRNRLQKFWDVLAQPAPGANFMRQKLGVKIPPGGISPNLIKNPPLAFLLEDRFLLKLGEIYSKLRLMKLTPGTGSQWSLFDAKIAGKKYLELLML